MLPDDLTRQNLVEMGPHRAERRCDVQHPVIGQNAHFGVLQGDDIAGVDIARDAVETDHLASHMESDDLFPPVARHYRALQEAEADCVKAVEMVRRAVKRFSPLDSLAGRDHVLNAFNFLERQPER